MTAPDTYARARVCALLLVLLLLAVAGCRGQILFFGDLWPVLDDDDSSSDDDDATVDDDDSGADDDDSTAGDDDVGDDDDVTGPGGEVACGPTVDPGVTPGEEMAAYSGQALVTLEHELRGGFFSGTWAGCEARHFFDAGGSYVCGIKWSVSGVSYGEQYQSTRLVSRFTQSFSLLENTCSPIHPDVFRPTIYYRITVPFGEGTIDVLWSDDAGAFPNQMDEWTSLPWDGEGEDEPEIIEFEYQTEFAAGSAGQ